MFVFGICLWMIGFVSGLLSDRVPPVQTVTAVCTGHGSGGHAAAAGLVRSFRRHEKHKHCALCIKSRLEPSKWAVRKKEKVETWTLVCLYETRST